VFIYAISVVDAYAIARRRWVAFLKDQKNELKV